MTDLSHTSETTPLAPGVTVLVRDEEWLVTAVESAASAPDSGETYLIRVRGTSPYVRDTTATFYTDLDDVHVLDPTDSQVVPDASPHYRRSRLWLESRTSFFTAPRFGRQLQRGSLLIDARRARISATQVEKTTWLAPQKPS